MEEFYPLPWEYDLSVQWLSMWRINISAYEGGFKSNRNRVAKGLALEDRDFAARCLHSKN